MTALLIDEENIKIHLEDSQQEYNYLLNKEIHSLTSLLICSLDVLYTMLKRRTDCYLHSKNSKINEHIENVMTHLFILKTYLLEENMNGFIDCFVNGAQFNKTPLTTSIIKKCIRKVPIKANHEIESKSMAESYMNVCLNTYEYIIDVINSHIDIVL